LILSQIYHNAEIVTYLLPNKAEGDVEKLVLMKERLTIAMIDYSGFKYKMVMPEHRTRSFITGSNMQG
jgi:hypothetical protein